MTGVRVLAGVCVAGVVAGLVSTLAVPMLLACGGFALGLWVIRPAPLLRVVVVLAASLLWGAMARDARLSAPPAQWLASEPAPLTGQLVSDAMRTPTGIALEVQLDRWRARVTVAGGLAETRAHEWTRGRRVTAPMRLRRPDLVRNPGAPSERWQRLTRRYDLVGTIKSAALVDTTPARWPDERAATTRRIVRDAVRRHLPPAPDPTAAIVTAILIGDRAGLDDDLQRRLQEAGVFHVIAISGGNVALLAILALGAARLLSRSMRVAVSAAGVFVAVYGFVVGGDPSVSRAVAAACVYFGLRCAGLAPSPVSLFAAVAAGTAVVSPFSAIDVGAWLSFGATFGLLVVLPRLLTGLSGPSWRRVAIGAGLATLAAEVVILPMTVSVFGRVSAGAIALNLLAIPSMALTQIGGLALVAGDALGAGRVGALVAAVGVEGLLATAAAVELAPWLSWRVPPPAPAVILVYAIGVTVALAAARPRVRHVAVGVSACLALWIVTAPLTWIGRPPAGWLRVTFLDVGQGDAALVQTPSVHALLVDAGGVPSGRFDVGGRIVTPAVWALGERRLDVLALTHGDLDHVGGAASVIDDLRPREVWEGTPVEEDAMLQALRRLTKRAGATWRRVRAGHEIEMDGVTLVVRHPPVESWQRVRVRNDDSLVVEVRYGRVSILLTGDAGPEFERAEWAGPRAGRPAAVRVLKVGHHGSRTSSSPALLARFPPHLAVISAGAGNLFGHPSPDVLARLTAAGAHVLRTDRHGAVIIETDGSVVRARGHAGGRWDAW